jgi:uncharacterized protein YoaH (UPF0181 family)
MTEKKVSKNLFSEFTTLLENQRKEMEKLAKPFLDYPRRMERLVKPFQDFQQRSERMATPILEYQQKLLEDSKRFQEALVQNVLETMDKVISQTVDEQRKQTEEINKLLSEGLSPNQATEYVPGIQQIQEIWIEQLKKSREMIESFFKTK